MAESKVPNHLTLHFMGMPTRDRGKTVAWIEEQCGVSLSVKDVLFSNTKKRSMKRFNGFLKAPDAISFSKILALNEFEYERMKIRVVSAKRPFPPPRRSDKELPPGIKPSPAPLVDICVNYKHASFRNRVGDVINLGKLANVTRTIYCGTNFASSTAGPDICRKFNGDIFATCGVHPHDAKTVKKGQMVQLKELCEKNSDVIRAVGECGLDYNRNFSPAETQREVFEAHVKMAVELKMPLFCHEREASEDFCAILDKFSQDLPPVCVHCFTGERVELEQYVSRGYFIGVTGFIVKKKRGETLRSILADVVPIEKLMLETDAPFMNPGKGKTCFPYHLPIVAQCIAGLYNMDVASVANQTTKNAETFFGLPSV